MSEHADVIREALPALHQLGPTCRCKSCAAHAAVSALVAERDAQARICHKADLAHHREYTRRLAAEAEVARLQAALEEADQRGDHHEVQAEGARARVTELEAAGRQWLAETGPGQHINTAKGRGMMRRALAKEATTKEVDGGESGAV